VVGLSAGVEAALAGYDWPGNVRELRNVIERAAALCAGPVLEPDDLPDAVRGTRRSERSEPPADTPTVVYVEDGTPPPTLAKSKQEVEIRRILEALARHNNNRVHTAAELGISRIALYKKLHKYGLMKAQAQE
jgi:two-component system response regulator AtoC